MFADPLSAASAPDPASPFPVARLRHHQQLHPPLELGWFGVESGRRREADKRIALSSRNDIFDQHFHITPAEALSRITPLSYSRILLLLSPFPSSSLFFFSSVPVPHPPSLSPFSSASLIPVLPPFQLSSASSLSICSIRFLFSDDSFHPFTQNAAAAADAFYFLLSFGISFFPLSLSLVPPGIFFSLFSIPQQP